MPLGSSLLARLAVGLVPACLALASTPALAGQVRGQEWWLDALHVTQTWHSTRGAGVTVAVLSTGVDPHQADLAGSVTTGPDYTHSGRVSGGKYWGHRGTAMASLIAGHGHGHGDGIMGVAPAAKILSVRVTLDSGDPLLAQPGVTGRLPGAIAKGIRYAVAHGAQVIDLPLDPVTTPGAAGAGGSKAERSAAAYARAHDVVLVAPAGDGGAGSDAVNYPAAYPGVISVGAFNANFVKAPFSSHQSYVTVTAAGEGVVAAVPPAGYTTVSSTSAASAVTAGIVALIRARYPGLSPGKVTKALTESTVYHPAGGRSDGSGYGTVDAARALTTAKHLAAALPTAPATGSSSPTPRASTPAVSTARGRGGLASKLVTGTGLAGAVGGACVVLGVAALAVSLLRRRRSRASRLAGVRAAAEVRAQRPAQTGVTAAPGYLAAPPGSGVAAAGRAFPDSAFPGQAPGSGEGRGSGAGRAAKTPKVTGGPPWGPAPRPDSELPWARETAAPPPAAAGPLPRRQPQAGDISVWDAKVAEAWPGGPRAARPERLPQAAGNVGGRAQAERNTAEPGRGEAGGSPGSA